MKDQNFKDQNAKDENAKDQNAKDENAKDQNVRTRTRRTRAQGPLDSLQGVEGPKRRRRLVERDGKEEGLV